MLYNPYQYQLADLDKEYELVQRWGSFVPTLTICTLLSACFLLFRLCMSIYHGLIGATRWTRFRENYWFPIIDLTHPRKSVKARWFFKAFLLGTYPSELFPEISGGVDLDAFEKMIPPDLFSDSEVEEAEDEGDEESEEDEEEEEDEGTDWNASEGDVGSDWDSEDSDGSV